MFPKSYFAVRYFAPAYYPPIGSIIVTPTVSYGIYPRLRRRKR